MSIEFYTGYLPETPEDVPRFLQEYTQRVEEAFATLHEEGSWTPILVDGVNGATHSAQAGRFIRVGNMVHVWGRLTTTALASVSGDLLITGLPYLSRATSPNGVMTSAIATGMNLTSSQSIVGAVTLGGRHIILGVWKANTGTQAMQHTEWSDDGDLLFHAVYERDAQ